jgi:nucleoside-diphosphate-sugar epimerase
MAGGADQTLSPPTVLLAGASSQIGVFAIPRLLDLGFDIIAVSRSGRPPGWPDIERVEWLDESAAIRAAAGCRYLLSAGPMDLAHRLLQALDQLKDVVVFSSTSLVTKAGSENPFENAQVKQLQELESELQSHARARAIRLVIFRPTLVYGCGLDANISRLANWIQRFGFMPVNGQAAGLRQPVHADDLAAVAAKALLTERELPPVFNVAGGEVLSYAELVSRIFPAVGKPVRLLRLPEWLFVLVVKIAGLFRLAGGLNAEMVRRQAFDLVFDDNEARESLDHNPRSFNPIDSDFSLPDL